MTRVYPQKPAAPCALFAGTQHPLLPGITRAGWGGVAFLRSLFTFSQYNTIKITVYEIQVPSIMQLHAEYIPMPIPPLGLELLADVSLSNNLIGDNTETP